MRIIVTILAAAALAGAAGAAEAPDSPIATAGGASAPPAAAEPSQEPASRPPAAPRTVDEQIAEYLRSSPALADAPAGLDEPRRVRGEVSVGVGTHGYRSAHARADIPIGRTGTLSVAAGQTRGEVFAPCAGRWTRAGPAPLHGCGPYDLVR